MAGAYVDVNELLSVLSDAKLNKRTQQIQCNCVVCGKEGHMYINYRTFLWECKKCWSRGNIFKLLRLMDRMYMLQGATVVEQEKIESIRTMLTEQEEVEEEEKLLPVVKLPVGFHVAKNSTPYLLGRGVSAKECRRYGIGTTEMSSKYRNYIIMPVYDNGEVRGFVGRYANKVVPNNCLRYKNSLRTEFGELLYGYDEITEDTETVILVEGAYDKISVDRALKLYKSPEIKCVCTFGKKISKGQIRKLLRKRITTVVLLYDFDAIQEIRHYGMELDRNFVTYITYTTKKDIDECTQQEVYEVFSRLQKPRDFCTDVIGVLKRK